MQAAIILYKRYFKNFLMQYIVAYEIYCDCVNYCPFRQLLGMHLHIELFLPLYNVFHVITLFCMLIK